ncbi:MFS transporter [Methanocorpusculum vombati]|uniref:MFS transporter n=1 Tax=Methanocorpusculum vombati TaxID=3002864 RepID=A0ABT4INI0_9EURY|nr:MFS transporter [Methanocorpusculum vombati]MCZ9318973.1 MFS transporter [Methanocorpusculum sp.]MCZ0863318.1 MFS transporter [Methanocorpusculum vombati]MDE2520805.1 MFS transporter [Methanocorpusculum sp.]MDE2533800.1 MFS transporter [Methanocorpusculum sp.]MDE2547419.1 MFS transporter [Methanocorpusculum sp.]
MLIERPLSQKLLMILAAAAVFMDYLDTSIVSIALPAISESFGSGSSLTSWVMTAYLLALGSTLLLFGKLADRTGLQRVIFTGGFVLFTVASFLCGIATDIVSLIGFRIFQGVAAAMMVATATMLITLHLPKQIQPVSMGVIATAGGAALALGPGIGGVLTQFISWHWIFFINIPVGIAGVLVALFLIPKPDPADLPARPKPFDSLGAVYLAITLVTLLAGLELGVSEGWTAPVVLLIVLSPVFGWLFLRRELRHPDPILSARLLYNRTVMWAAVSTLCITLVYLGVIYVMPFLLTEEYLLPTAVAGGIMLLPPVAMALIGIPAGAFVRRCGCMVLCNSASFLLAAGMVLLGTAVILSNMLLIFAGLVLVGLGMGLNEGPSIQRITIHSPLELQGSSGGLIFTVMNVGCVLGVALFSVAAAAGSGSADVYTPAGVAIACAAGFAVAVIALITSRLARDTVKC